MAKQIDKSMLIHEIIEVDPGNAAILMAAGMNCDEVIADINAYLAKKEANA